MTITLTIDELDEFWKEAQQKEVQRNSLYNKKSALLTFESWSKMPEQLGEGYEHHIEVFPEVSLRIEESKYSDDVIIQYPESQHPLQFGTVFPRTSRGNFGQGKKGETFISGGGVQKANNFFCPQSQKMVIVEIYMPPELLANFFPGEDGEILPELKIFLQGNDLQTLVFPKATTAIQSVVEQIVNCPYQGVSKRIYLQGKVVELMALQLAPTLAEQEKKESSPGLRTETVDSIYQAREILLSHLDNPPSLWELAKTVGVSERTLRRGFQELFHTTVFAYLTSQRMEKAKNLLRSGKAPVTEVAMMMGYSSSSHFTAAFKRQFGITPRECLVGKLSVLR